MTYTPAWYLFPGALTLSVVLAYWGWWSLRKYGLSVYVVGRWMLAVLVGGLWAPTLLIDELQVDEDHMQWNAGFWWSKEQRTIRFAEIEAIGVERRRSFRYTSTVWVLRSRTGVTTEETVTDLWQDHYDEIKAIFRARGVRFAPDA